MGVVPPLTGVEVKVTGVPWTTGLAEATMEMLTGNKGSTVMMMGLDVAGFPETHNEFEVTTHETLSEGPGE